MDPPKPPVPLVAGSLTALNADSANSREPVIFRLMKDQEYLLGTDAKRCHGHVWWGDRSSVDDVHCAFNTAIGSDADDYVVTITDLSKKGVYIDNEKMKSGSTRTLANGRVVSLGGAEDTSPAFKFAFYPNGHILTKYNLGKEVGEGSYGKVFKAVRRQDERTVAIKIINLRPLDAQSKKFVRREIALMRTISHPNITELLSVSLDKGVLHLVMEFAPYGDVAGLIIDGWGMDVEVSRTVTRSVCEALSYLHTRFNMVHRDIKPENVLIFSEAPRIMVKVTDFGFAKILTGESEYQTMCGTPDFMSPEVAFAGFPYSDHYDHKVDSWSMGIMLFLMLSGYLPFPNPKVDPQTFVVTLHPNRKIEWKKFPWSNDYEAKDLITRLLHAEASQRLSITDAIEHPWLQTNED